MEALTTNSKVEVSKEYIGANLQASVVEADGSISIPLFFSDWNIELGGEVNVVSAGAKAEIDIKKKKISLGLSFVVGLGLSIGLSK